jgi:hypothetical protein
VEGSCEHGNEPCGSEVLEKMCEWRPVEEDSAPWKLDGSKDVVLALLV